VQDASQATYEPPFGEQYARIDWSRPLEEVYDLIRGCDPQPGAYTLFEGKKVRFYGAKAFFGEKASAGIPPGQVIELTEDGILVAGNGGAFLIKKVRPEDEGKIQALEFAKKNNIGKGGKL
jgi:methionyl-tRNA formyltransferase